MLFGRNKEKVKGVDRPLGFNNFGGPGNIKKENKLVKNMKVVKELFKDLAKGDRYAWKVVGGGTAFLITLVSAYYELSPYVRAAGTYVETKGMQNINNLNAAKLTSIQQMVIRTLINGSNINTGTVEAYEDMANAALDEGKNGDQKDLYHGMLDKFRNIINNPRNAGGISRSFISKEIFERFNGMKDIENEIKELDSEKQEVALEEMKIIDTLNAGEAHNFTASAIANSREVMAKRMLESLQRNEAIDKDSLFKEADDEIIKAFLAIDRECYRSWIEDDHWTFDKDDVINELNGPQKQE